MKAINPTYIALGIALVYRGLALTGVVAILDWIAAPDAVRGGVVVGALWGMAATTDLRRGDR